MGRVCRKAAPSRSGGRGWGLPGRGLSQWLRGLRVAQSRRLALEKGRKGRVHHVFREKNQVLDGIWKGRKREENPGSGLGMMVPFIRGGNSGGAEMRSLGLNLLSLKNTQDTHYSDITGTDLPCVLEC